MSRVSMFAVVSCLLVLMLAGPVFAIELVTNGGFELNGGDATSIFTGWTVADQTVADQSSAGSWYAWDGTTTPFSYAPTPGPASGTYYAIGDEMDQSCSVLYQTVTIPSAGSVTISYDLFANNWDWGFGGGSYVDPSGLDYTSGGTGAPNQNCRVDILYGSADPFSTSASDIVQTLYGPGDDGPNPPYDWTSYSFSFPDVSPGSYMLRFGFVDSQYYFNMGVDNVSVDFTPNAQVPEPSSLLLLLTALPFGIILKRRGKAA